MSKNKSCALGRASTVSCVLKKTKNAGLVALITCAIAGGLVPAVAQTPADTVFITSARENALGHVTLPLFRGSSGGQTVFYIITESSDAAMAAQLGVNHAPALANARNSDAVQYVNTTSNFNFPATVNFSFTLTANSPGARGNSGYSPLVQLPNGIILNASHVRNNTGNHDRVVSINTNWLRVTLDESDGFQGDQPVRYIATEATDVNAAIAERTTFAPRLANIPSDADANLALMRNGQSGFDNVERQGEQSASATRDADPLNVLEVRPGQSGYSPIWEVEPHRWTQARINAGTNTRQRDYDVVEDLEAAGALIDEPLFPGAGDVYVNCPVIARRSDNVAPAFTPGLKLLFATSQGSGSNFSNVTATIKLKDQVAGVLVAFTFEQDRNATNGTCLTDSGGGCTVTQSYPVNREFGQSSPVTITVTNLNRKGQSPGAPQTTSTNLSSSPVLTLSF